MVKTHPTYEEIQDTCFELRTYDDLDVPDLIIGLTRGGLFPAVLISHSMNIPMVAVDYSSTKGRGDNVGQHFNRIPDFADSERLLIVDDICDSGYTMSELSAEYVKRGHEVQTFALYWKESSVFIPSWFWQQIPQDSPWIVFPWEVEKTTK